MTAGAIAPGMLDLEAFAQEHPDLVDPDFDDDDFIPTARYIYGYWEIKELVNLSTEQQCSSLSPGPFPG